MINPMALSAAADLIATQDEAVSRYTAESASEMPESKQRRTASVKAAYHRNLRDGIAKISESPDKFILVVTQPALPPHVGGLTPEQCGVLTALRDGSRMWRKWSECEHGIPSCDSQYRVVEQETTADWSCAPRWKAVDFTLTEGYMACANITFRAENPRGSKLWLRLKEFVRRAKLNPASSRCHGGSERKTPGLSAPVKLDLPSHDVPPKMEGAAG